MEESPSSPRVSLLEHYSTIMDPRVERTRKHLLTDLLSIAICGFICGVDNWVELEDFGKAKSEWFKTFLRLPHGIPSHDTFGRFFAALDPEEFSRCFIRWVKAISEVTEGEVAESVAELARSFASKSRIVWTQPRIARHVGIGEFETGTQFALDHPLHVPPEYTRNVFRARYRAVAVTSHRLVGVRTLVKLLTVMGQ